MRIIGIDPGLSGAIAILDGLKIFDMFDMPIMSEGKKNKNQLHNLAARRAEHVVGEIDRVKKGLDCIKNNRLIDFGSLLYESHESSIENFENSCKELNIIVDCAKKEGALGARLSGGGWGGSVVVLTTVDKAKKLSNKILENSQLYEESKNKLQGKGNQNTINRLADLLHTRKMIIANIK